MWITNGTLDGKSTGDLYLVYAKSGKSLSDKGPLTSFIGNFIVGLFCYICSFLFFLWLFFFIYALLAGLRFTLAEDRFFNILRL
jgi:hypothetical protein